MKKRIAVVGAGLAGVSAARVLSEIAEVCVFEKSRGLGGRMATRRAGDFQFDHGAQFFTARSPEFRELLGDLDSSIVQGWDAKVVTFARARKTFKREWFETHYVATPQMNSLVKHLASDLTVNVACRVVSVDKIDHEWRLTGEKGQSLGEFDWLICAAPAPQTLKLLPAAFALSEQLRSVSYSPCYALMLGFDEAQVLNFDAAVVRASPVSWIAVNQRKPGRPEAMSLLVHSDNDWAREHLEDDDDLVIGELLAALAEHTGVDGSTASYQALHRWRYARVESALSDGYLLDTENRLAACGDWCLGNRVEDAFRSGRDLANALIALLAA